MLPGMSRRPGAETTRENRARAIVGQQMVERQRANQNYPPAAAGGEQLKMFMTPKEIHAGWQPLDADRHPASEYSSAGSGTLGSAARWGNDSRGDYYERTTGGGTWTQRENAESSEDLWARKHEEAHGYGDEDSYDAHMVGGRSTQYTYMPTEMTTGGSHIREPGTWQVTRPGVEPMTLGESIRESGVQSPIRLGQNIGSEDKPQVVGGHHRLAVASDQPDRLVPVLHHQDIWEARSAPSQMAWKYT